MAIEMIAVTRKEVNPIVRGTFPNYKGRKIRICPSNHVTLSDLNWSGGTRSQYRAVTLDGIPAGNVDQYNQVAPWANPVEGMTLLIPEGVVVVEHTMFCGKDNGLRIWTNPQDMPKLLQHV